MSRDSAKVGSRAAGSRAQGESDGHAQPRNPKKCCHTPAPFFCGFPLDTPREERRAEKTLPIPPPLFLKGWYAPKICSMDFQRVAFARVRGGMDCYHVTMPTMVSTKQGDTPQKRKLRARANDSAQCQAHNKTLLKNQKEAMPQSDTQEGYKHFVELVASSKLSALSAVQEDSLRTHYSQSLYHTVSRVALGVSADTPKHSSHRADNLNRRSFHAQY